MNHWTGISSPCPSPEQGRQNCRTESQDSATTTNPARPKGTSNRRANRHVDGRHFGPPPFWKADHADIMPRHQTGPCQPQQGQAPAIRITYQSLESRQQREWLYRLLVATNPTSRPTAGCVGATPPPSNTHYTHTPHCQHVAFIRIFTDRKY
jgi:hypothetical protein